MSLPSKSPRSGTRGYAHLVEVDVPIARVWQRAHRSAFDPVWSGQAAEIDPREGGLYRVGKSAAPAAARRTSIFST